LLLELRRSSGGIRGHDDHDRQISTGGVIRWFLALLLVLFVLVVCVVLLSMIRRSRRRRRRRKRYHLSLA
jgi:heme/copper-type cytochrome/quinol oxidase subunit 2